jgi:hypothetical protein
MLMRHQGEQMTQVLELGSSLRQAQSDLDAEALRELTRQRRQLTTAVTHQGRVLAGELGQKVTDAVADQVEGTLHAAMVDEQAAAAVRSGMLVAALTATGVESADVVEAIALPSAIGMTARPRSGRSARPAKRAELSVVPEPAEAEPPDRAEQERKLRKARKRVSKVQARTLQAADELEEVRRRAAELEHELEQLADEATSAEQRRDRAEERYEEAQEALERAQAELVGLERA